MKWESSLSVSLSNRVAALGLVATSLLSVACSTGAPARPVDPPAAVAADDGAQAAPARERRSSRRGRDEQSAEDETVEVPERLRSGHERAIAALVAEDWIEAELELEQLALEFPSYAGPLVNLAIVYAQDGRDDEAVKTLQRALDIEPMHVEANNELAILLREQGRFGEAEEAYLRALQADPGYALAHYNFGVLLDLYLGRQAEALEHYEQYQSLSAKPDQQVGRWIIDLRRRLNVEDEPRVAQEDGA
jgi:tetratricopeptide (TPR) repeat protein